MLTEYTSLWEIPAKDIDGNMVDRLGDLYGENKATLVVNVATDWELTDQNYKEMVQIYE